MKTLSAESSAEKFRIDWPLYRVNFWKQTEGGASSLDGWLLWQCDLWDVLDWVEEHKEGRQFEVLVAPVAGWTAEGRVDTYVRLIGWDPNSTMSDESRELFRTASGTSPGHGATFGWTRP